MMPIGTYLYTHTYTTHVNIYTLHKYALTFEKIHTLHTYICTPSHMLLCIYIYTYKHTPRTLVWQTWAWCTSHTLLPPFLFVTLLFLMDFAHSSTTVVLPLCMLADSLPGMVEAISSSLQREALQCITRALCTDACAGGKMPGFEFRASLSW